ncbi:trimethylamine methyltransferase family protein [Desulfococcus sp.]|uniref:trimethylamine methyltransferase family protein n=1 Tax=Desulfococcus sp. TaxID=2025834 RepID=UPI0035932FB1
MKDNTQKIHALAVRILEEAGIRLHHPDILDMVRDNGVRVEESTAFFRPDQVMDWVKKAPASFTLYARNPVHDMVIGGDRVSCAPGYGCAAIYDASGNTRDACLADYIELAKLVHQSPHFHINGGILAQPSDVPADQSHLIMLYAAITHSDKCLMGIPGSSRQMQDIMEMAAILFGGESALREKPRILTMISTISPLQMDDMALSSILAAARYGQPLIISPAPAAGTTGPIDLASNIALATAEALAGIAVAQMIRPGLPVIFGLQCYGADLRTGNISIGSPAYALQAKYCAALARMYGIPCRCGGTTNDAKAVSPQSGYESMLSMLTAWQNRVNLIVHSAGILDSFSGMSYEQFIVDLEIIDMIRYYEDDIEVGEKTLNFDLIREVGPGGQFLTTADTMRKCRTHSWSPEVSLRGNLGGRDPHEAFLANITRKRQRMIADYKRPVLPENVKTRLLDFLAARGVDREILNRICP